MDTKQYYLRNNENYDTDRFYEIHCNGKRIKVINLYDPPHLLKGELNNIGNIINKKILIHEIF